ncbi:Putative cutinase/acetylxylan esterase, alpha/Beta hydrolase [Colletotrichum destructivum]|uniref:Cutinase/acetylxylan esterase, alpha/Beta hydrolase n=1 Tax=Colletotrichum destructivum TaxID=34406 RepID=A0AAX4IP54_9PEZI|nr:Putative cutinase/acetylxylan esterase, alpha/Beta hydrolase [Colletotrichum destructivum]
MRPETALLLIPAALAQTLCPLTPCSAVHVLLVRGTNEPYPGLQQPIAEAVCAGWDCTWASVEYPAVFRPSYCASVEGGVANTLRAVTDYATRCPDSRIVLSGFSQGGQVVGDLLGGGGGEFVSQNCVQEANEGISSETFPGNHIAAALVWGSPRHVANQSYNLLVGARLQSGFPREGAQLASLNRWSSILRDYCNFDDPACAQGTSWDAHENYGLKYAEDAAQFVRFKTC